MLPISHFALTLSKRKRTNNRLCQSEEQRSEVEFGNISLLLEFLLSYVVKRPINQTPGGNSLSELRQKQAFQKCHALKNLLMKHAKSRHVHSLPKIQHHKNKLFHS